RIVNSNMASAVRLVSTSRGIDPRNFTLVAFGGGGPLHGAMVADEVGIRQVLIPWSPGILSAFGLLVADLIVDVVEAHVAALADDALDAAARSALRARCDVIAAQLGLEPDSYEIETGVDLRYAGQGFELPVWTHEAKSDSAADLRSAFEKQHRRSYGYSRDNLGVQVVNRRARIIQRNTGKVSTPIVPRTGARRETAPITIDGRVQDTIFMDRGLLVRGETLAGPAVLEEATSTIFVPPGWQVTCLECGDLLLTRPT